ncbi:uncharacterized protein K452DRAFT_329104 [Aplosporella prunicola CBS 121167]|uniref:FAD-binding domain-containing protein n=1 Tax=Aplosporella prunicola CBS 121167 TaxID=1176127 RepID=A0A6A6B0Q4_9PEZI|nr:uncharacterized protein K452DRAFT_329104 [Aplosporella prunicola CBS 121167]KAF2137762.1 hypothetical protein K452DRAFT_329104 [Aplosporella prunicola CBS 121167]
MEDKNFRVAIVGGSIAGLTLALALEKHGIDFVVLEAYPEIASQVGASIAVLPNGFRILDQLGCFEDIMERVNCTIDNFIIRDLDGSILIHVENLDHHLVQRHGYPMIFFERRMLVEVLYQHIQQKEKVLTKKRVTDIHERADGVTVTTQDGEEFEANIVVGADGVHSAVGKHIWQTTTHKDNELRRDEMLVQYRCLFGISSKVPGISEDTLHHVSNEGSSLFAASGPNARTYWCLFTNTGTTYYGEDLPPYDEKDVAETAQKHKDDGVTETVKFGDLYERKLMAVQTPLHEYVLGRWYSQRCIVIGDAVHKFNPIIGLGGMSAIETCAALTNGLVSLVESHKDTKIPSSIESVFRTTQEIRKPRATALVDVSKNTQYRFAMETPLLKFFNRYYFPGMGSRSALRLLSEAYPGATSVKTLPVPKQPRALPYEDELLQQPVPRNAMLSRITVVVLEATCKQATSSQ